MGTLDLLSARAKSPTTETGRTHCKGYDAMLELAHIVLLTLGVRDGPPLRRTPTYSHRSEPS
jgi:hypothetical protein